MHARSENLHDGARSAPEICDIFMNRRANSSYFHEARSSSSYSCTAVDLLQGLEAGFIT